MGAHRGDVLGLREVLVEVGGRLRLPHAPEVPHIHELRFEFGVEG